MRRPTSTQTLLAVLAFTVMPGLALAQGEAPPVPDEVLRLVEIVRAADVLPPATIEDPALVKSLGRFDAYRARLLDEAGARVASWSFLVVHQTGHLDSTRLDVPHMPERFDAWCTHAEAATVAARLVGPLAREFCQVEGAEPASCASQPMKLGECYEFQWQPGVDVPSGLRDASIRVGVHAAVGRVTSLDMTAPSRLTPADYAEEKTAALPTLGAKLNELGLPAYSEGTVMQQAARWRLGDDDSGRWSWSFQYWAPADIEAEVTIVTGWVSRSGTTYTAGATARSVPRDQLDRALVDGVPIAFPREPLPPLPSTQFIDGKCERLNGGWVLLVSSRFFQGYPPWRVPDRDVCVIGPDGALRILDHDRGAYVQWVSASSGGPLCCFDRGGRGGCVFLDVETGRQYRMPDGWDSPPGVPAVLSATTGLLAIWHPYYHDGLRRTEVVWALYLPSEGDPATLAPKELTGLAQTDLVVRCSSDDSRVAILTRVEEGRYQLEVGDLDLVAPAVANRRAVATIDVPAVEGGSVPREIPTICWSPDDRSVMVSAKTAAFTVAVQTGEVTRVTLPELLDPLLKKPLYVYWEQTRILADGRLALVAEPRDRSRGARVYACNPDGSGLELLTPAEEDPLPVFVFPETGTPAFEWP